MEQPTNNEIVEMTPEQKLGRVESVLVQLKKEDESLGRRSDGRDPISHEHEAIIFAREILEAVLGSDSSPEVEWRGRAIRFDLQDSGLASSGSQPEATESRGRNG